MSALVEKKTGFDGSRTLIQGGFCAWCSAGSIFAQDMPTKVSATLRRWKAIAVATLRERHIHSSDSHTPLLQFCPARKRLIKRQFISRFQAAPSGEAARNARQSDRPVFQKIDKIVCSGFAFDIGGKRENDLRNPFAFEAFEQFLDPQIFGANMIERRNFSSERMIAAAERAGFLQRKDVCGLFDNA